MNLELLPVEAGELKQYKLDMQKAFQKGFEAMISGKSGKVVLDWTEKK